MAKKFLVIGVGRFGQSLIRELHLNKNEVVAVDTNEKLLHSVDEFTVYSLIADAKDDSVLKELAVKEYDAVVVAIGDEFESSILITKKIKDLGAQNIICKASNQQMGEILLAVGADEIIYPEKEAGVRIAKHLSFKGIVEYIDINEGVSGIEVEVPEIFHGKSLSKLDFSRKYGLTVALILRNEKPLLSNIGQEEFQIGDFFLLIGDNKKINQFKEKFCK